MRMRAGSADQSPRIRGLAVAIAVVVAVAAGVAVWSGDGLLSELVGGRAPSPGVPEGDEQEAWTSHVDEAFVADLVAAEDGSVWTAGSGVRRWQPDGPAGPTLLSEHGLLSNSAHAVAIGDDGTVWIAHRDGLSAFDGDKWTRHRFEEGWLSPPGNSPVGGTLAAGDGRVWALALHPEGAIAAFDGDSWTVHAEDLGLSRGAGIFTVAVAPDGAVWWGTEEGAAVLEDGQWTVDPGEGATPQRVDEFAIDGGTVWAGTPRGLTSFDGEEWVRHGHAPDADRSPIIGLAVDGDTVWVGTREGTAVFDGQQWSAQTSEILPQDDRIGIDSMAVDAQGAVWATSEAGVLMRNDGDWAAPAPERGLPANEVNDVAVDGQDTVWAATSEGLASYDGQRWEAHSPRDGPPLEEAVALAVDDDGRALTGMSVGAWRREGDRWQELPTELQDPPPTSLAVGADGTVWAGTSFGPAVLGDDGWTTFDGEDLLDEPFDGAGDEEPGRLPTLLNVRDVAVADDGTGWVVHDEGLSTFDGEEWRTYTAGDGLPDDGVSSVAVANDGTVWAGSREGLAAYDGEDWTVHTADGDAVGYGSADLAVSDDGVVWAGDSGRPHGLSAFDGDDWVNYTADDGLASNDVTAVAVADDGTVWIGTANGGLSAFTAPDRP